MNDAEKARKNEEQFRQYMELKKHWRSWGSWFSWGSPIGLGLFYTMVVLSTAGAIWIYTNR